MTRLSLKFSSCCSASATSAEVARPTSSSARSRRRISSPSRTAVSRLQSEICCCESAQYCCSIDRTCAMIAALKFQTDASALSRAMTMLARLASRPLGFWRGAAQQRLGDRELGVGGVGRREDVGRAVRVQVADVVLELEDGTGGGPLLQGGLEGRGVLVEDDRVAGPGGDDAGGDRVVDRGRAVAPEDAGGEVGVEDGQGGGDLRLLDRRVVHRREGPGTERAGDAGPGPGVQRGRLEPAERDALGTQRDDADDLGVVQADPDRLGQGQVPDLVGLGRLGGPGLGILGERRSAGCR